MASPLLRSMETRGPAEHYGEVTAVAGVDPRISRHGPGLLGPNGAGNSTPLRMLLGQTQPGDARPHDGAGVGVGAEVDAAELQQNLKRGSDELASSISSTVHRT
ncbi:hypothetical protein [Streptomyces mirabilis]|uniref:hypothetical protein n=1 Tax=Streptomyces mirabilis TaxID=68239 RepID=UPI0036C38614